VRKLPKSKKWKDEMSKLAKSNGWGGKKRKVIQLTKSGEVIKQWNSITEAAAEGFSSGGIVDVCKQHRKSHKGYIWKYENM